MAHRPCRPAAQHSWRAWGLLGLLVLPPPASADPGTNPLPATPADAVVAAVNRERELQGLAPVEPSESLRRAAQAHVEDMARLGYFAFTGPAGAATIEALANREGYRFALVTEKLVRAPLAQSIQALALGWRGAPGANRSSLFHPEVREIGVGMIESGDLRTLAIVLATALETGGGGGEPLAALSRQPSAAATALLEAINTRRAAWRLPELRADPKLERAAARHAEALLAALLAGRPPTDAGSLADRVAAEQPHWGSSAAIIAGEVSRQRRPANRGGGTGSSIGQVIVADATTAAMALDTALAANAASDLREARFRSAGIGLAVAPPAAAAAAGRAVWVIALSVH